MWPYIGAAGVYVWAVWVVLKKILTPVRQGYARKKV